MSVNCNQGTLNLYIPNQNNPWSISKILFLFRRIGFSIKFSEIESHLNTNPGDLIDQIFDEAINIPVSPDPGWANFDNADFTASGKNRGAFFRDHQKIVFDDFLNNGFRERLTLFWSNHFVTEYNAKKSFPSTLILGIPYGNPLLAKFCIPLAKLECVDIAH